MGIEERSTLPNLGLESFHRTEFGQLQLVSTSEVQRMRRLEDYKATAVACFPDPDKNGKIFPKVLHGPTYGESTVEYLQTFSGDPARLENILSPTGQWILVDPDYQPFRESRPENVEKYLRGTFETLYDLCEFSPDGASIEGYNRHGADHHRSVARHAKKLLELADVDDEEMIRGIIAANAHDIGYIFDRDAHALVGARMLPVIWPRLAESYAEISGTPVQNIDLINRTIENHDTDILRSNLENIFRLPAKTRLETLASFLGPSGLATAIADKEDIGRLRISKNIKSEVIKGDPHAAVNFWGQSKGIGLFSDRAKWKLQYEETITEEDKKTWPTWAKSLARDIDRGTYRKHFHGWVGDFNQLYSGRVIFMAEALLALFPHIKGVELEFSDKKYGSIISETFERANLDQDIKNYREANDPRNG